MQNAERSIAVIAVVAIILNLSLVPLSSPLVVVSISSLASLYMYMSIAFLNQVDVTQLLRAETWAKLGKWRIGLSILSGIGWAVILIGTMFRYFAWPSSALLLQAGLLVMATAGVLGLIFIRNEGNAWVKQFFLRASAIAVTGTIMLLTPELLWFEIRHRDKPSYIEAFRNAHMNPDSAEYQAELDRAKQRLNKED